MPSLHPSLPCLPITRGQCGARQYFLLSTSTHVFEVVCPRGSLESPWAGIVCLPKSAVWVGQDGRCLPSVGSPGVVDDGYLLVEEEEEEVL